LEFGERAKRQHQAALRSAELGFDLATMKIGHGWSLLLIPPRLRGGWPPKAAGWGCAVGQLRRRERQLARRLERELGRDLAVVLAGEFERRDLEGARDRAEVRDHDLKILHRAIEEGLAHQRIRRRVLEQAAPRDSGAFDAGAVEQLAPASGGFRMRDVDGLRI